MHGSGRYGLQCLTNLDLLPAIGALVIAAPLKIKDGSGSPLRVIALVPAVPNTPSRRAQPSRAKTRRR
jgi:kynurenine formamidase